MNVIPVTKANGAKLLALVALLCTMTRPMDKCRWAHAARAMAVAKRSPPVLFQLTVVSVIAARGY